MAVIRALSSRWDLDERATGYFHGTPEGVSPHCTDHITLRTGPDVAAFYIPPKKEFWLSFYMQKQDVSANGGVGWLNFFNRGYSESQPIFRLNKNTNTAGTTRNQVWTGSAWTDNGVNGGNTASSLVKQRIHINMATSGGFFRWYSGDTLMASAYSGNTDRFGLAGVDKISFGCFSGPGNSNNRITSYSGILVTDEDPIDMDVVQRKGNSSGAYSQWNGGSYTRIVKSSGSSGVFAEGTTLTAGAENLRHSMKYASLAAYSSRKVEAVVINHAGRESVSGKAPFTGFFRTTGGVNRDGTPVHHGTNFNGKGTVLLNNGGSPWAYADISGGEFGILTTEVPL